MPSQHLLWLACLAAAPLLSCESQGGLPASGAGGGGLAQGATASAGRAPLAQPPVMVPTAPEQTPREDLERALLHQINQARRHTVHCGERELGAAPALQPSEALTSAARGHARQMAGRGFFQHLDPEGRGSQERAAAAGFRRPVAENLAWGQTTAEQVVAAWLQSPGHCATMMSPHHQLLGVGYAEGARSKPLWVLMVGQAAPGSLAAGVEH